MTTFALPQTLKWSPYIPHKPTPKQLAFLLLDNLEVLYGGSAGGGKSDALLMAALQHVDVPGYAALLLRRNYADLALPGALMDRAGQWLGGTAIRWQAAEHTWRFPSGATLTFGYLDNPNDKYRYQSAQFQYLGWDELTQFTEDSYRYLFSRLRRLETADVPLRVRAASNPGGIGHEWVRQRFLIEGREEGRVFIPARLQDNPFLDRASYVASLSELDPVTRAQLLDGDWTARKAGSKFRREWFSLVDDLPGPMPQLRYWDLAATEARPGQDPDWTAGVKMGQFAGLWYVLDVRRARATPGAIEDLIRQTAQLDGYDVAVRMEQEPGAAGKSLVAHYQRHVLVGYDFRGIPSTGAKELRANPLSAAAEAGNIKLLRGPWVGALLDELEAFLQAGYHDDQVDALAGAFSCLRARLGVIPAQVHGAVADRRQPNPLGLNLDDPKYQDADV